MNTVAAEAGSFRDRRGRVFDVDGRIYRSVMPMAVDDYEFVRSTGLIDEVVGEQILVAESKVDRSVLNGQGGDASFVLEHPRIPFISYPYEWSFSTLKAAALFHLDLQLRALSKGVTLTDASAYNIQFDGPDPIFIDSLSFRRYKDGEFWDGHPQFCEQFVNQLLLRSVLGVPHNAWYRGSLEGISASELSQVLPWRSLLSWNTFTNVFMQARLQRSASASDTALKTTRTRKLPKIGFEQMLRSLRRWIAGMEPRSGGKSEWQDYAQDNSYADEEAPQKRQFVADFVATTKPGLIFDLGCNTGDYSALALETGARRAIGFDFDQGALDYAYERARRESLNFLPLHLDAANPSPEQGWLQKERQGLARRAKGDAVLALALVHHLVITHNIPLDAALEWITGMAPHGVIEFVPKADPMVQRLLQLREDLFDDYEQKNFETLLAAHGRIVKSQAVSASGRTLYYFERHG
jgi:ribosomal protein L11 methylase PrmA